MGEHAHKEIKICPSYLNTILLLCLPKLVKLVPKLASIELELCKIYTPCKYGHLFFT